MNGKVVPLLLFVSSPAMAQEATTAIVPVDLPDAERRVIVDFELGFGPVLTGLSGNPDTLGVVPTDGSYEDQNLFLDGNVALGTRGILWPTFNLYGLGGGVLDLRGRPGTTPGESAVLDPPALHPSIAHRYGDARALQLHLAYGEIEGITTEGILSYFHLRAGRQFHFSRVGTTFDGITLGYDGPHFKAAARVGSRSSIYDRTQGQSDFLDGGLLAGGDLAWDFGEDFPLSIRAEVLHYQRTISLTVARERVLEGGADQVDQATTIGDLVIEYAPTNDLIIDAAASFAFPSLSHLTAGLDWNLDSVALLVDFDEKVGRDIFYDLAGGRGLRGPDRFTTYETFRLNFPDRRNYTDLDARLVLALTEWLELEPHAGFRVVHGDVQDTSPYDATFVSYGLTGYGNFKVDSGNGFETNLGFRGVTYFRGDGAEGNFRDAASGGEELWHEISAGLRYVHGGGFRGRRLLSERSLSIGAQGFLRLTRFDNRYLEEAVNDGAFGVGADALWQFTRFTGVRLAYEFVRDSSVFYDYLGGFHAVRVAVKGSF